MVKGIGVDLVSVRRIAELVDKHADRFLHKCFSEEELTYCLEKTNRAEHLAARFAAKEAFVKALPIKCSLNWRDVEVINKGQGPEIKLRGEAANIFKDLNLTKVMVSLSHERDFAIAFIQIY